MTVVALAEYTGCTWLVRIGASIQRMYNGCAKGMCEINSALRSSGDSRLCCSSKHAQVG